MGEERHAYGTSLFCVSRRLFIGLFAFLMTVLCYIQIFSWIFQWNTFYYLRTGTWKDASMPGCVGQGCYEVFSCLGLKDASQNMREPFTTLAGAIAFPLGIAGAHLGYRSFLRIFGFYLVCSAGLHVFVILWDVVYLTSCNCYPANMIYQVLLPQFRIPPVPLISLAAQQQLLAIVPTLTTYPVSLVDGITGGLNTNAWYFTVASLWAVFLCYVAYECNVLGSIMERGPLGLGVHYGLAQWDEVLDHDSIRRFKERQTFSKFIDDARLPAEKDVETSVHGYMVPPGNYGSFDPEAEAMLPGPAQRQELPYQREAETGAWGPAPEPYLEQEIVQEAVDERDYRNFNFDQPPPSSVLEVPEPEKGRYPPYGEDPFFDETSPNSAGGPFSIGGSSAIPGSAARIDYA